MSAAGGAAGAGRAPRLGPRSGERPPPPDGPGGGSGRGRAAPGLPLRWGPGLRAGPAAALTPQGPAGRAAGLRRAEGSGGSAGRLPGLSLRQRRHARLWGALRCSGSVLGVPCATERCRAGSCCERGSLLEPEGSIQRGSPCALCLRAALENSGSSRYPEWLRFQCECQVKVKKNI